MKNASIFTIAAVVVLLSMTGTAQSQPEGRITAAAPVATEAAQRALATFGGLVTERNYLAMGFDTPDEVRRASLGTPFRNYMIRLDELQKYEAAADPLQLLHPTGDVTYPVVVDGRVKSSILVAQRDSAFEPASFGAPHRIRLIAAARERLMGEAGLTSPPVQIEIPALQLVFVGATKGPTLLLVPTIDDPRFGLKAGSVIAATDIMPRLAAAAREHNGNPT